MTAVLTVSEVFGPTWQGEGPNTGRRCGFIRLGLCNLECHWCDAAYTWDWSRFDRNEQLHHASVDELVEQINGMGVERVVITGGEPLVQGKRLEALVRALRGEVYTTEIETNGSLMPSDELIFTVDHWNVSPKLEHAKAGPDHKVRNDQALSKFRAGARSIAFKFVVRGTEDFPEVDAIVRRASIPASLVWVMPEGTDTATLATRMCEMADVALERGWNMSGRLHIDIWGNERGR